MGKSMTTAEQHSALSSTVHLLGVSLSDLWLAYFAMTGSLELFDLEAYIYGVAALPPIDRDILTQVLWELDPMIFSLATDASEVP